MPRFACTLAANTVRAVPKFTRFPLTGSACDDGIADIEPHIRCCRGHPVLFDVDLARVYGLPVIRLVEAIVASGPLPGEFCFVLDREECVRASAFDPKLEFARYAFTAHGAFLAAFLVRTAAAKTRRAVVLSAFSRWRSRGVKPLG